MTDIGKEYGAALFMLACEKNRADEYAESVEVLRSIFVSEPDYLDFLSSPGIPLSQRREGAEAALSDSVPEDVLSFLLLLCEKGRLGCFFSAADEYKALFEESKRVLTAKITSAVELSEEEKLRLIEKLEATHKKKIAPQYFTDASLLGGMIVELDGKIMDGSLRRSLHRIKEVMNT